MQEEGGGADVLFGNFDFTGKRKRRDKIKGSSCVPLGVDSAEVNVLEEAFRGGRPLSLVPLLPMRRAVVFPC